MAMSVLCGTATATLSGQRTVVLVARASVVPNDLPGTLERLVEVTRPADLPLGGAGDKLGAVTAECLADLGFHVRHMDRSTRPTTGARTCR
jgi:hypothetical protein